MTTDLLDGLARALIQAHQSGTRVQSPPCVGTLADALTVQAQVQRALGPVGGFKVGPRPEGPPAMAPIRADQVRASGAAVPVRDRLGIELEIGFELLTPPVSGMAKHPQTHFRPRIVIELVDTRLDVASAQDPFMKLADMQINAGLILGPALMDWDGRDIGPVDARLQVGDTLVQDGSTHVPGGTALSNLWLLCDNIGDHCGGLAQGQTVITGSLTGLHYFAAGQGVRGQIAGFGDISCDLV
ncbi:hydratase [Puniceibacterium sp. IMCC21224]|uniref:hydratase n=1 Tax=Puniceibacterium sp. IMCC21224 TaxID=1618204 RepID=UPI00064DECBB|nr:hydratase [Puniceibacterium sp. IMCC21224]KMK68458.1 2-keto-4-pentenoate hydratase [Puniceibacterium sp. IMCC21224]